MKLYIRAHDLGVKDIEPIAEKLTEYGLDGVQFVGYKCDADGVLDIAGAHLQIQPIGDEHEEQDHSLFGKALDACH